MPFINQMFIDGAWTDGAGSERFPVLNPADGTELTTFAAAEDADCDAAVEAAAATLPGWRSWTPRARSEVLRATFEMLRADRDEDVAAGRDGGSLREPEVGRLEGVPDAIDLPGAGGGFVERDGGARDVVELEELALIICGVVHHLVDDDRPDLRRRVRGTGPRAELLDGRRRVDPECRRAQRHEVGGFAVVWIPIVGGIMQLLIPAGAVVLGFIGRRKEPQAKAMWLTGIILGFVGIAMALLSIIFWSIAFASFPNYVDYSY